jgi:hypothetical protein
MSGASTFVCTYIILYATRSSTCSYGVERYRPHRSIVTECSTTHGSVVIHESNRYQLGLNESDRCSLNSAFKTGAVIENGVGSRALALMKTPCESRSRDRRDRISCATSVDI